MELRNQHFRVSTLFELGEDNIARTVIGEMRADTEESQTLCMRGNLERENREIPSVSRAEPIGAEPKD
jgi:hypothetical protein